jgi:hypothetical protein
VGASEFIPLIKQIRKGDWTNDPSHETYFNHWRRVGEMEPGETVESIYPAQLQSANSVGGIRPTAGVNVVVTDRHVYVDTESVERVGKVAGVAGKVLDTSGLSEPLSFPREQVQISAMPGKPRVAIVLPDGREMVGKTDLHIGRSKDMTAGEQIRNLGRMLRR